jgi:HEPN domain-containing protein
MPDRERLRQVAEEWIGKAENDLLAATVPRTHDIEELVALLPGGSLTGLALKTQRRLTSYAVVSRYPGPQAEITLAEARAAVKAAGKVRTAALALMKKTYGLA